MNTIPYIRVFLMYNKTYNGGVNRMIGMLNFNCIPYKKRIAYVFAFSNVLLLSKVILAAGFNFVVRNTVILNMIIMIVTIVMYIWAINKQVINRNVLIKIIILLIFFLLVWGSTAVFFPERLLLRTVRSELSEFLIYCIPAIIFIPLIKDFQDVMIAFYKLKSLLMFFVLLSSIKLFSTAIGKESYSMGFGHAVLWPTIIFFSYWFKLNNIKDLVYGILGIICIFLFGSRYPILCIFTFIGVKLFQTRRSKRSIFILFISILIIIIMIFYGKDIASWLYEFLYTSFGINNRSLRLIVSDLATYSSGRDEIHRILIKGINKSPIWGYGVGGASFLLSDEFAHSFILDVFSMSGYVIGGIILCVSTVKIVKLYKNTKSQLIREFIIICLSIFLPIFTFQTGFWSCRYYWYLIALSIGNKYKERV